MGSVFKQKNIERLIVQCEKLVSNKTQMRGKEWKLQKYVSALDTQIEELQNCPSVDSNLLKSFRDKSRVLREILQDKDEFPHFVSTADANSSVVSLSSELVRDESVNRSSPRHPSGMFTSYTHGNELLMRASSKRMASMKEQLFSKSGDSAGESTLRQRSVENSIESVLHHHQNIQDEIAEDMIKMARSLKHNSLVAKDIITSDTKVLVKTTAVADENIEGVEKETNRLREHTQGYNLGIWVLLVVVFIVFMFMILFIRIVPKPK